MRLGLTGLLADDLDKAKPFHTETRGFQIAPDAPAKARELRKQRMPGNDRPRSRKKMITRRPSSSWP
jgi:hypothetical protein